MSSMLTLVLLGAVLGPLLHHFATTRNRVRVAGTGARRPDPHPATPTAGAWRPLVPAMAGLLLAATPYGSPGGPPSRPIRTPFTPTDPLAKYRAVTGTRARVRWWQRLLSLVGLAALVLLMGALVALTMGLIVVSARVLLDVLVS